MLFSDGPPGRTGKVCLRDYQIDAVKRIYNRIKAGIRRLLIVAPTGSGKTTIAGRIISDAASHGKYILFIAHRRELIIQAYNRFLEFGIPEDNLGVIMANDKRRRPVALVQVASIDTLRNRPKPQADLVFVDEAHRAMARSYRSIATHYCKAIHLGLTATPFRADGKGLKDAYDEIASVSSVQKLIKQGFLVEPRVFTVAESDLPDLSGVHVRGGDYMERELADAVDKQQLVGNIVDHWHKHAKDLRTVVFAASVKHSKHIAERFIEAGVAAEHLDGNTDNEDRDAILSRLDSGSTRVVSSVGVLCEGWDQPSVKCAILARPTKSTTLYLQQAGRILRPFKDQHAIILDHAGCAIEHGLPQDDRMYSLEGIPKKKKQDVAPPTKVCPECFAVVHLAVRACPHCDYIFEVTRDVPQENIGDLVEVDSDPKARMEQAYARFSAIAAKKNYHPGWIYHKFKSQFGVAPPKEIIANVRLEKALTDILRSCNRNRNQILTWDLIDYHLGKPLTARAKKSA